MVLVRRATPTLEARFMPLYPTAEECSHICDWIAEDIGHYDVTPLTSYGVGKDPVTGLVQIRTRFGLDLVGLGQWVIRLDVGQYEVVRKDDFEDTYEVLGEDVVPIDDSVTVGLEPEKENI